MANFEITKPLLNEIEGVKRINLNSFDDQRGSFTKLFCQQTIAPLISGKSIAQVNYSVTDNIGTIRGMHFQFGSAKESKVIRCLKGRVYDVLVDVRRNSPTFLQWQAFELSADNADILIVPEGVAHGFQTLEMNSELLYLHTAPYTPNCEGGLLYNDPSLAIDWPLTVSNISERDMSFALIDSRFTGVD